MDPLTQPEVTAFVGDNAGYYLRKWHARLDGSDADTGFNGAAFFLGGVWLVYRKMYAAAAVFFGIIALESALEVWLGVPRAALYFGTLVVSVVFGSFGNGWYFSHARRAIARERAERAPHGADLAALAKLGGTNSVAAWAVYLGIVALVLRFTDIRVDSVVGIAIGAPSLLLCAVWFLAPPGRRERVCVVAGTGSFLAVAGLLVWETVSADLRNRREARGAEEQRQAVVEAGRRRQEDLARAAELGRERDAHWKQALALTTQGRHAEALEEWDRALASHRQGAAESAAGAADGPLRRGRALALAQTGDHARAAAEAAELAGATPATGDVLYELARVYALSAGAARGDARPAKPEQGPGDLGYEVRAVELLTKARDAGYFRTPANVDKLLSDRGLGPVRSHAAFRQWLKSPDLGRLVAERCLDRASSLGEEGQPQLALLWSARGLEAAPAGAEDLARACRVNLAAWHRPESLQLAHLPHPGKVLAVAFADGGKRLVALGSVPVQRKSTVRLCVRHWDVDTEQPIAQRLLAAMAVQAVALSADGKTFTVDNNEDRFRFWDARTGGSKGQPVAKESGRSYGQITLSQDGRLLLASNAVWEVATGRPLKLNALRERFYHPMASSADGKTLATYIGNYEFALLRAATGERVGPTFRHEGTGGFGNVAAFSADGARVMTAGNTILVWRAATRQPVGPPFGNPNLHTLAFSPDGESVVTGGGLAPGYVKPAYQCSDAAQLWDVGAGKPTGPRLTHKDWVAAAAFSPDGSRLVTGSHDKGVRLWKVPRPVAGEVEQVVLWAELETDTALDEHGEARPLDAEGRDRRRKRLQELGGPPRLP